MVVFHSIQDYTNQIHPVLLNIFCIQLIAFRIASKDFTWNIQDMSCFSKRQFLLSPWILSKFHGWHDCVLCYPSVCVSHRNGMVILKHIIIVVYYVISRVSHVMGRIPDRTHNYVFYFGKTVNLIEVAMNVT